MDSAGGMLISTKKLERVLSKLKNGKGSPDQISGNKQCSGMSGKAGEIVVRDVLGHELSGGMAVLSDCCGSESGGYDVFDQVQADRLLMRDAKSLGLRVAQATLPKTYADAASSRTIAKMAERNCGGAVGRKEGIRAHGLSSCFPRQ